MALENCHYTEVINELEELKNDLSSIKQSLDLIEFQTKIMRAHNQKKQDRWVKGTVPHSGRKQGSVLGHSGDTTKK